MEKIRLLVIIVLLAVGMCGCMNHVSVTNNSKDVESYLTNKYNDEFTFVSYGDNVWSSKSKSLIYADENGQYFTVKENSGYFSDNYCSVLFDESASKLVTGFFDEKIKAFVSTQSVFLSSSKRFDNVFDYLKACAVVNVVIYTAQSDYSCEEISKRLLNKMHDCCVSVVVYSVAEDAFDSIINYESSVNVLSSSSFWIKNNEISLKSWEE